MRTTTLLSLCTLVFSLALGCASSGDRASGGGAEFESAEVFDRVAVTVDGLRRADIDMPGILYIRDDHQIGSFDAFLIPEATISYRRYSRQLSNDLEDMFKASLEQSLIDAARDGAIPIVRTPGACVLQVGMSLVNVDLDRASLRTLGKLTLVMEFRDSLSGEPLLRYAADSVIESEDSSIGRDDQIQEAFDDMVAEMEIGGALRAAGLADDNIRSGCQGTLAARGRGELPSVSTR